MCVEGLGSQQLGIFGNEQEAAAHEGPVAAGRRDWPGLFFAAALVLVEVLWVLWLVLLVWWLSRSLF
jgi:hypothetical protein